MVIQMGDLRVKRGEKAKGCLAASPEDEGLWAGLPLLVVNGAREGPSLVVSGGIHGDEFEGPAAIQRLWRQLDPQQMQGVWIGVPVVNGPAYQAGTRCSPLDGLNMNRIFPGREDGSLSERIAHVFFHRIVARADCFLDLHAGGNTLAMTPMAVYLEEGNEAFRAKEVALAQAAGIELLWRGKGIWAAAHVAAVRQGIPAILAEIGQEGRCSQPAVELAERTVLNVMKHIGMIGGAPQLPERWTIVEGTFMQSHLGGCFFPRVQPGQRVQQGEHLGTIVDVFGDVLATVEAPYDGIICAVRTFPATTPADWTVFVGKVVEGKG